ncbi:putative adhesin RP828 precursor [bacterium BMS3Bbin10]|nr:putative adhesin RP828 precursor [bacterium BMS3Bbin10]
MGHFRYSLVVAALIAAGSATSAQAQKFQFPPPPVTPVPAAIAVPDYSAWYLRGDIAWSLFEDPDMSQQGVAFSSEDIDDAFSLGGGFGYYFSDSIRGDVTVDHRFESDVEGVNSQSGARIETNLSSTAVLANLYFDFGGRDYITPYLGAGLGFSYNDTGSEANVDLAAAAMAGVSFSIHDGFLFDAGYRFLYLGDAETSGSGAAAALSIDDVYAHELRVGFRYELN